MEKSWRNLTEIWGNTEEILYIISNKSGEIPREGVIKYAQPISKEFEEILNNGTVELHDEKDLKMFVKNAQKNRYYGINFSNVGKSKNTIEFRLANGTLDPDTWIENINLFGGIVRSAQDLAIIQTKPESERNPEEQRLLECFENIKSNEVDNKEKLKLLLEIVIPEDDRAIYMERYEVNSNLIKQNSTIKEGIKSNIAKVPINTDRIAKKVFMGEDGITYQEYERCVQKIKEDLNREEEPSPSLE